MRLPVLARFVGLAALAAGAARLGGGAMGSAELVDELGRPRPEPWLVVQPAWVDAVRGHLDLVVLHVGEDRTRYDAGHIPGARFLSLPRLHVVRDGVPSLVAPVDHLEAVLSEAGVSSEQHVLLYGDLQGLAAARAFFVLELLGHARVSVLDGGMEAWIDEGRPLETREPAFEPGEYRAEPRRALVVDADWVERHRARPGVLLVDARPADQYRGDEAGEGVPRPGHIPGAVNVYWRETLTQGTAPRLLSRQELSERFGELGATRQTTVVAYCRTGMQSSHIYLVARWLGLDAKVYDGSFIDWSRRGELPVERSFPAP